MDRTGQSLNRVCNGARTRRSLASNDQSRLPRGGLSGWPRRWLAMCHVPRLPVRCARLRRGGAAPRQARASSFPASAARVRHASSPPIRRARVSRPRSPPISWRCSMPSRSPKRWSVATIGAAAPAASCRRSGRNGWSRSSPEICGMGALQAVKMALGITTLADSQEDISYHVLRFRTERLFTVWLTTIYGRGSAQPQC